MILKQKWSPKVKGFVLVFEDIVVLSVFQRLVACTPSVTASDCVVETYVMISFAILSPDSSQTKYLLV